MPMDEFVIVENTVSLSEAMAAAAIQDRELKPTRLRRLSQQLTSLVKSPRCPERRPVSMPPRLEFPVIQNHATRVQTESEMKIVRPDTLS